MLEIYASMNRKSPIGTISNKFQQKKSSSQPELAIEVAKLKRQLAEQTEDLAILKKAATYFAKNQKNKAVQIYANAPSRI